MARPMGSGSTKTLAKAHDGGGAIDRSASARPDLTPYEIALFCNVLGVAPRQMMKAREEITLRYDLGPRGAWIIGLLQIGVASPSALTEALCIGRSLVTAEINRLQQAGLVTGNQNLRDGRRIVLELTDEGRRVSQEVRSALNEFVTSRLAGHSREEVLTCLALLQDFVGGARIGELRE
jgi:DNA-binding MarR family transcriptional regulator